MVDSHGRLTAWLPDDERLREVRATWTADGDAISITSDGRVAARRLGQAIVRAHYENMTGSTTVHVVGSIAGVWHGSMTVADCWQLVESSPSPCAGRRGLTAPLVINVTQLATADNYDNLRATAAVFTPPATGSFIGAVDSSGLAFLDGYVERPEDSLFGGVQFRWQLENGRLVPWLLSALAENRLNVQLSVRIGSSTAAFWETWELSPMTR